MALWQAAALCGARAGVVHSYQFTSSYADDFGGPELVPNGSQGIGTLGASTYSFAANQGLSLSSALSNNATYSILVDFSFTDLTGYRKIIDFKDRGPDAGLYNLNNQLVFFNGGGSSPPNTFQPNIFYRLVITRDNSTNAFDAYVNGVFQLTFTDSSSVAVFSATNSIINFFNDDFLQNSEASGGTVDQIAIYNNPLTAAQVLALGGPGGVVPEPGTFSLVVAGLAGLAVAARRRFLR